MKKIRLSGRSAGLVARNLNLVLLLAALVALVLLATLLPETTPPALQLQGQPQTQGM